ncbi:exlusion protein FxsA [Vibrio cholerae]|nr:exlusion protein FxsA [Vibrio cholerae]TXX61442.1 exlusion protein FxsA [Vibrio cholerae]
MSTRGVSSPIEPRWFRLLCLSFVVMRCQPLRRALCAFSKNFEVV